MPHFIYRSTLAKPIEYVGTRKNTGRMYESRTTTTPHLNEARVFNTKSAAENAGRRVMTGEAVRVVVSVSRAPS